MNFRLVLGSIVISAAAVSQATLIDNFTGSDVVTSISSGNLVTSDAGSMIGGERDRGQAVVSNPLGQAQDVRIGSGLMVYSAGTLLQGSLTLQYDGAGEETGSFPMVEGPGLGPVVLSGDRFRLSFLNNDLSLNVAVTVKDQLGNSATSSAVAAASPTAFLQDFMFSSFTGVDFSQVKSVTFDFGSAPSGDFSLNNISTVPEPASLAILGLGASALLRRRKK